MPTDLYSNEKIRNLAIELVQLAARCEAKSWSGVRGAFLTSNYRTSEGISFIFDDADLEKVHKFTRACTRKLGSVAGDEAEIDKTAWKAIGTTFTQDPRPDDKAIAKELLDKVQQQANQTWHCILPNFNLALVNGKGVTIGPVQAISRSELADFFSSQERIEITEGQDLDTGSERGKQFIAATSTVWLVELISAQNNAVEEAKWLVGVALSLLRLSVPAEFDQNFWPRVGKVEAHPHITHSPINRGIPVSKRKQLGSTRTTSFRYLADETVISLCDSKEFVDQADAVFKAGPSSIGYRVKNALGWLARARQSNDRSKRLLFLFTAIESVLTPKGGEPVSDTIARYAGILLSDHAQQRDEIFKLLKSYYVTRSNLIHRGMRSVDHTTQTTLQIIAEAITRQILKQAVLTSSFDDFHLSLKQASFGLTWPDLKPLETS